jgi:hypothetical protein
VLDGWKLGNLLGADDLVGVSEASLLGFCDGWELGKLLGPGDSVGGSDIILLGFCEGPDDGVLGATDGTPD